MDCTLGHETTPMTYRISLLRLQSFYIKSTVNFETNIIILLTYLMQFPCHHCIRFYCILYTAE